MKRSDLKAKSESLTNNPKKLSTIGLESFYLRKRYATMGGRKKSLKIDLSGVTGNLRKIRSIIRPYQRLPGRGRGGLWAGVSREVLSDYA